jgi:hypothetical protein
MEIDSLKRKEKEDCGKAKKQELKEEKRNREKGRGK